MKNEQLAQVFAQISDLYAEAAVLMSEGTKEEAKVEEKPKAKSAPKKEKPAEKAEKKPMVWSSPCVMVWDWLGRTTRNGMSRPISPCRNGAASASLSRPMATTSCATTSSRTATYRQEHGRMEAGCLHLGSAPFREHL